MGAFHDYFYYLIKMCYSHSMPSRSSSVCELGGGGGGGGGGGSVLIFSYPNKGWVI